VLSFLGFLDLISILVIGVMASLASSLLVGDSANDFSTNLLQLLKLQNFNPNYSLAILSVLALLLMALKTFMAASASFKLYKFLGKLASTMSKNLLNNLIKDGENRWKNFTVNEIAFSVKTGIDSATLVSLSNLAVYISDGILILSVGILILIFEPLLALLIGIFSLIFGLIGYQFIFKKQNYLGKIDAESSVATMEGITQLFSLLDFLKTTKRTDFFLDRVISSRSEYSISMGLRLYFQQLPKYIFELLIVLFSFLIIFSQFILDLSVEEAIQIFTVFIVSITRVSPGILRILAAISAQQTWYPLSKILFKLLRINPDLQKNQIIMNQGTANPGKMKVNVKHLFYKPDNSISPIIKDITYAHTGPGLITIVGDSGAGKSTFIKLMLGLLPITSGTIEIDGVNRKNQFSPSRVLCGYVPQETFVLAGDLRENIAVGIPPAEIDLDQLKKSLIDSGLPHFAEQQVLEVSESNVDISTILSGGEKQRIGLARALYQNPEILFLDEPTSALDSELEEFFIKTICNLKSNYLIFCVTHSEKFLKHSDEILQIKEGRLL
jgi:ABC-type bacteriocin/lantibiotic exporter with double-glycine peptidase domain